MTFDAVILFFFLGAIIHFSGSSYRLPKDIYQFLSLFLMIAIGLKGGIALSANFDPKILPLSVGVLMLGLLLPLVAYPLLRYFGGFNKENAASFAAHYGSVSVGTYAVAIALLESQSISYEAYFPVLVVLLEFPAIIVAMYLCQDSKQSSLVSFGKELGKHHSLIVMLGCVGIGIIGGSSVEKLMPVFGDLFYGLLALFLLEMGIISAKQLRQFRTDGLFTLSMATFLPVINSFFGLALGLFMDLSAGGLFLMMVLAASASYIAVPVAMRSMLPNANHDIGLTASLGVTFPFNILAGMPIYLAIALALA